MNTIVITQGDCLNAFDREVTLVIDTDLDLIGCKAVFQLGDFQQTFDDITSKRLPLIMSCDDTRKCSCGTLKGALKVYDCEGKPLTIYKNIQFLIEPEVVKDGQK